MKELNDDVIQQLLFEELKKQPAGALPADFSASVVKKINRQKRAADTWFYLLAAVAAITGIAGIYILLTMIDRNNAALFGAIVLQYKWVFIFGLCILIPIQYLDQKLLSKL